MSTKSQALRQIYSEANNVGSYVDPFAFEEEEGLVETSWLDRNPFFQFLVEFFS